LGAQGDGTRRGMPRTRILDEVRAEDDIHIWPSELQLVFRSTRYDIWDEGCDDPDLPTIATNTISEHSNAHSVLHARCEATMAF